MDDNTKILRLPEHWAELKNTNRHLLAGARAHAKWQNGVDLVSEEQFDAALAAVRSIKLR